MPDYIARARELGLDLQGVPLPEAVYIPARRTGNLIFSSGNTNDLPDESLTSSGRLGAEVSVEEGHAAGRQAGINCIRSALSVVRDLNSIVRVVRTTGYVASADGFNQQPQVINGASELFRDLFGEEAGVGARMAVGFVALPGRAPTEIEVIFETNDPTSAAGETAMADHEARARELGLDLSSAPSPLAVYRPAVRTGNLVFVSGNVNMQPDGNLSVVGKVGREVTLEQAKDAARVAGINCLKAARSVLGGDLNKVVKVVRTVGFVASEDGFNDQPKVINGASELFRDVFGEDAGVGARLAMGLMELPLRAPVEVEVILEVRD